MKAFGYASHCEIDSSQGQEGYNAVSVAEVEIILHNDDY
jgi:hypothetical protein